jgi:hypothetical protein
MSTISGSKNNQVFNHSDPIGALLEEAQEKAFGPGCARADIPPSSSKHPLATPPPFPLRQIKKPPQVTTTAIDISKLKHTDEKPLSKKAQKEHCRQKNNHFIKIYLVNGKKT